jgi:hypothetical protein
MGNWTENGYPGPGTGDQGPEWEPDPLGGNHSALRRVPGTWSLVPPHFHPPGCTT